MRESGCTDSRNRSVSAKVVYLVQSELHHIIKLWILLGKLASSFCLTLSLSESIFSFYGVRSNGVKLVVERNAAYDMGRVGPHHV